MRADKIPVRVVILTLDQHLARVVTQAQATLALEISGIAMTLHAAADWESNPAALERCKADIATADIVIATMLFLEDQIRAIKPALEARREHCDAMIVAMSATELVRLTRLGAFRMDQPQTGPLALIKKLRGKPDPKGMNASSGAKQMAMLRRLPKILRLIPGKAQDVRAYFLVLQYWLAGSESNITNMVRLLLSRYADGPRAVLRTKLKPAPPAAYPDVGVYHPQLKGRISERADTLPAKPRNKGTVGLLVLRSYVLANDTAHYDAVIAALEARGLRVIPAFSSGLDSRPAIEKFFTGPAAKVDAILSLTGFSLVGGPAYNDSAAAQETLSGLDVPYIAAQPVEFQTLERWASSASGLTPVEATIMVTIPELDGAIAPMIFGGRSDGAGRACTGCDRKCVFDFRGEAPRMQPCAERTEALAGRVFRLIEMRRTEKAARRIAVVLFNFPPNSGASGTAAYLSVFASLYNTLSAMKADGYDVELPASVDALRERLLNGNAKLLGTDANVHAIITTNDHVRREPHLAAIEKQWGPAPGRQLTDGRNLFVMGERFGKVFVGLQPGFGYEGDPMRLLFEGGLAPTHAFSAFYRWLREDFGAQAVLHFGTHGAMEFMPGKQVGLSARCWPERLIGDLPNFYLYAANNPSEGAIAKRRSSATLISYLTPPVAQSGLYKGLADLKSSLNTWYATAPDARETNAELLSLIHEQAAALALCGDGEDWDADGEALISKLAARLYEYEQTLIPEGLHVVGEAMPPQARIELLLAMADANGGAKPQRAAIEALVEGAAAAEAAALSGMEGSDATTALFRALETANGHLGRDSEIAAILHALDAGYIRPVPGGDLLRTPEILPTGRNLHGFDPFRIPSTLAMRDGAAQAQRLLARHATEGAPLPESIAFVLWGTDNLKSEGAPIGQVLALMGARARFDSYGRLCGAELIPLEELGRPRIDVMTTLSGIFRDLLPLQTRMLAEAAFLAATADEPLEMNFIRKHALAHQSDLGCDMETAALRVFSNADGAYGANVNHLIDAGCWTKGDELADAYQSRKCFAYGRTGKPSKQPALLASTLKTVDLAYQTQDSLERGVTTEDQYVDTLGGISRAVRRAKG
ncbi:MAG: magnesium chelatase subunit H, partial [Rhizomicrobium sp.]